MSKTTQVRQEAAKKATTNAKKRRIPIIDDINDWMDSKAAARAEYYAKKRSRSFDTSDGRPSALDTLSHVSNTVMGLPSDVINTVRGRKQVNWDETDNETLGPGTSRTVGKRKPYYRSRKK